MRSSATVCMVSISARKQARFASCTVRLEPSAVSPSKWALAEACFVCAQCRWNFQGVFASEQMQSRGCFQHVLLITSCACWISCKCTTPRLNMFVMFWFQENFIMVWCGTPRVPHSMCGLPRHKCIPSFLEDNLIKFRIFLWSIAPSVWSRQLLLLKFFFISLSTRGISRRNWDALHITPFTIKKILFVFVLWSPPLPPGSLKRFFTIFSKNMAFFWLKKVALINNI